MNFLKELKLKKEIIRAGRKLYESGLAVAR